MPSHKQHTHTQCHDLTKRALSVPQNRNRRRITAFSNRNVKICKSQGRTNPAFSKPCLCLSDTRHFRHFRRFRGFEGRGPCFQWVECKFIISAVFVKTAPCWQGTKTPFTKKHGCATPKVLLRKIARKSPK